MNNLATFTIVIPTFRRSDTLFKCLDCLVHYFDIKSLDHPRLVTQVIVSDDANESKLRDLIRQRYAWCEYTRGPARGPAANRNHGAHLSSSDWIVFTDDDCLPQPGWIEAYSALADQVDLLEGRTSSAGRRTRVDEECPINETGGLLWSCNFAIRREAFLALGGFNEDFPAAAMEDVDFNLRAIKAGLSRAFVPDAVVLHPWRLRKGAHHVRQHAFSVATFTRLHPDVASRFCSRSQALKLLRMLKRDIQTSFSLRSLKGLSRQLHLDVLSVFLAWEAVRQLHRSRD